MRTLAFLLPLALLAAGCSPESQAGGGLAAAASSPAEFGSVRPFQLTERSGRAVALADLRGQPWVASFVFTRCSGPCPRVTATMRRLQDLSAGLDARLVSFSVDPRHDSPRVLAQYADGVGADPERWWFLTGAEAEVDAVVQGSFQTAVTRAQEGSVPPGERVTHSTRLAVVDGAGRIRGFYAGEGPEDLERIVERLRFLASEPATR